MIAQPFYLLTDLCGLSHREAANFLNVRPDTVKSWSTGRREVPAQVLNQLAALAVRIDQAATEAIAIIERQPDKRGAPGVIELGLASDDAEAQAIGWPCVGAQRACLARVAAAAIARGLSVRIVPRGSTEATAAAADSHDHRR